MQNRQETLRHIREHPETPVLIVGGGVNGCGLFRELALQGVDCLLVDKADFVSGASSKSSRMIHGGLRYLETREFALVRESLADRNALLTNAPHYVAPLKTSIPLFSRLGGFWRSAAAFMGFSVRPKGRGSLLCKFGLMFYDFVTRKNRKTPKHYFLSRARSLEEIPGLNPDIVTTAIYWDAQISQAERLCIEMLADGQAANPSCRALNYARPTGADGQTVTLRDEAGGEALTVRPRVVVNAAGAWVDFANAAIGIETQYMGGTKGSHVMLDCPQLHRALGDRMIYYEHADGRVCIAFNFGDRVLMGSTDIHVDDPDDAHCTPEEIDYMFATLGGVFPGLSLTRDDIVYAFCGVRPLAAAGGEVNATISRGHSLRTIEPDSGRAFPVHCMVGGKWTTFRTFAEQTADRILENLGRRRQRSTEQMAIGGGRDFPADAEQKAQWIARVAEQTGEAPQRVGVLFERYGTTAEVYAAAAAAEPETPLASLPDYSVGEIRRIAADECIVHLIDLLCRRTTLAILGRATPEAVRELADIIAPVLGWDEARANVEAQQALAELAVPGRDADATG